MRVVAIPGATMQDQLQRQVQVQQLEDAEEVDRAVEVDTVQQLRVELLLLLLPQVHQLLVVPQ